jgi:hypothetical protein
MLFFEELQQVVRPAAPEFGHTGIELFRLNQPQSDEGLPQLTDAFEHDG